MYMKQAVISAVRYCGNATLIITRKIPYKSLGWFGLGEKSSSYFIVKIIKFNKCDLIYIVRVVHNWFAQ